MTYSICHCIEDDCPMPIHTPPPDVFGHPVTADCPDEECTTCSIRDCPYAEPLHYHHDGCPSCASEDLKPRMEHEILPPKQGNGGNFCLTLRPWF